MNRNYKTKDNVLLSLILLTSTLLVISLITLGQQVMLTSNVNKGVEQLHPQLYTTSPVSFMDPEQNTVYFTFDDGPSKNTEALLNMLKEEGVKATFFVCAQYEDVEYSQMLMRRMRDEGHTIALHTFTHTYSDVYTTLEGYLDDLAKIDAFVFEATGLHPNLLRFPGGSTTRNCDPALMRQIADEVTRRGYVFYDWTVPSGDDGATPASVETLTATMTKGVSGKPVEIILCHDNATPTTTPAAVKATIAVLREEGYEFDRLTNTVPPIQRIYE